MKKLYYYNKVKATYMKGRKYLVTVSEIKVEKDKKGEKTERIVREMKQLYVESFNKKHCLQGLETIIEDFAINDYDVNANDLFVEIQLAAKDAGRKIPGEQYCF